MTNKNKAMQQRRIRVRAVRRGSPDVRKLAAALIELARAQAEADAAAEQPPSRKPGSAA